MVKSMQINQKLRPRNFRRANPKATNAEENTEPTVPITVIKKEIVTSYLSIQQIRFEDLTVTTSVDYGLEKTMIPKMTIQPLIENALFYSQEEPQTEYLIKLDIHREKDTVCIQVANSGPPIDIHILEHLRDKTVIPNGNGVGLLNIDSRLRILFGESCGLSFENINGMTIVRFRIPLTSG